MRWILLLATLGIACGATVDPREIVRRALALDEKENESLIESYAYLESVETRRLNSDGTLKSVASKTHEITTIEGTPFRRLAEKDGRPLPPDEQREQEEAFRHTLEARRTESRSERARRIDEYQNRRDRYRRAVREIPDAFIFRVTGEENFQSRPAWVIEAVPRPGYRPVDRYSRLFTDLKGTLWIDKAEHHWVRLDAELIDTVTFGWILVRIGKGARATIERTRVDGRDWLPSRLWYTVSLRIGLVKAYTVEELATYRTYRKLTGEGGGRD